MKEVMELDSESITDEELHMDPLQLFNDNLGTTQTLNNPGVTQGRDATDRSVTQGIAGPRPFGIPVRLCTANPGGASRWRERMRSRVAFSGPAALSGKDRGPRAPLGYPYGIAPRVHRGRTAFAGGRCLPRPDICHYKRGGPRAGAVTWGPTDRRDEA